MCLIYPLVVLAFLLLFLIRHLSGSLPVTFYTLLIGQHLLMMSTPRWKEVNTFVIMCMIKDFQNVEKSSFKKNSHFYVTAGGGGGGGGLRKSPNLHDIFYECPFKQFGCFFNLIYFITFKQPSNLILSSSIDYFHCLKLGWPDWSRGRRNRFQGISVVRMSRWW